jgi:hypothetical protein
MESGFDMLGDFEEDPDLTEEGDGATEVDVINSSGWTEELALYSKTAPWRR